MFYVFMGFKKEGHQYQSALSGNEIEEKAREDAEQAIRSGFDWSIVVKV